MAALIVFRSTIDTTLNLYRILSDRRTTRLGTMASRVSPRRWLLRDIPRTGILLVWVAFTFSIAIYFIDWTSLWR